MLIESFSQTILRWLRIPPGTSLRKADGPSTSSIGKIEDNEYVESILDITVDDVCVGEEPLSVNYDSNTPEVEQKKLKGICNEFNSIVKWVARDLAELGYSVYDIAVSSKNKLVALPYLEEVEFYLTKDKRVVAFEQGSTVGEQLKKKLIFINFNKKSLQSIDTKNKLPSDIAFKIVPSPMQLKNAERTVSGLVSAEDSLARYRIQLGRLARWVNVDIGASQGDTQKDVVDTISSSINANSSSLMNGNLYQEFDDNLPVLPHRKGLGKAEIVSDVPSANIADIVDLDYWKTKLALLMRFPATYMDFSKSMDATAVSLLRGDLRYSKLCKSIGTKITSTINEYISSSTFNKYHPVFSLTQLPSSEDDDVIAALQSFVELSKDVEEFINGENDSKELKLHKLKLLQDLFATSVSSPSIQSWFEEFRKYIEASDKGSEDTGINPIEFPTPSASDDVELNPSLEPESTDLDEGEVVEGQTGINA